MRKYNFFSKNDLIKYFNATSDIDLKNKIVNTYDKLSFNEALDFINAIKGTGVNVTQGLTSDRPYKPSHEDQLTYQEADQRLREFANDFNQDLDIQETLNPYERYLYNQEDKSDYEFLQILNEAEKTNEEDNREFKSQQYYNMQKIISDKMDNYIANRQQEKAERKARAEAQEKSKVNIEDIWKNID